MNILLWIFQGLLAFWNITGGIYTAMNYEQLKSAWASGLPKPAWIAVGGLQALFALGLILPGLTGTLPKLTPISAGYLSVNSLVGCLLFAKYAGFPGMLWGIVPAMVAAFVAYGRMS